ncbi:MAG: dienelactone hydrolase family protein [Alphaproteobacteria bacterium]|nr:dienelactone hydrolase family protein [Alphaproteobacteria bacterium]
MHPEDLWHILGFADRPRGFRTGTLERERTLRGTIIEDVMIETADSMIPATVMRPPDERPRPAVLYCHAHGNRHDIGRRELVDGRPALARPYGLDLVRQGFLVICLDMPGFNDRAGDGSESALSKSALWHGQTLFGQMLSDLSAGLDYLAMRDDVDASRIATMGLSMGATQAYWLAALDERVSRVAHLCAFANIRPLIKENAHDLHGPYMTVPGLLNCGDMENIAGSIAPRPQLIGAGGLDPLTPPAALNPAIDFVRRAYAEAGAAGALSVIISPETGHVETEPMRECVLAFLSQ